MNERANLIKSFVPEILTSTMHHSQDDQSKIHNDTIHTLQIIRII